MLVDFSIGIILTKKKNQQKGRKKPNRSSGRLMVLIYIQTMQGHEGRT